jgi:phenylpropionate dioxygenase-like ring-hydroxylating dioxygenase large terminal subunit
VKPETEARILKQIERERGHRGEPEALGSFACFGTAPLPVHEYTDASVYGSELGNLFRRVWLPITRTKELAEPGSYVTQEIAGDPIAVVRGNDGVLRAFHNVCRHRGAQILRQPSGRCERLVCPYHQFVYDLDGRLRAAPALDSFAGVEPGVTRLPPVHIAAWSGWVFVSLAESPAALPEFLSGLTDELAAWNFDDAVLVERTISEQAFGWKVGVEAFLEPLHLPSIHRTTAHPLLDFRASAMDWFGDHSRMATAFRIDSAYEPDGLLGRVATAQGVQNFQGLNRLQRSANLSYLLFPATIFSFLPTHFTVFRLFPVGLERTQFVYELYAAPSGAERAAAYYESLRPGYTRLLQEDFDNLPWIQRGLRDSATTALPLSRIERRIRHFRARVRAWCAAPAAQGKLGLPVV